MLDWRVTYAAQRAPGAGSLFLRADLGDKDLSHAHEKTYAC